jgi:hypothetical protein
VTYCTGNRYDPFNKTNCRAGQQGMKWNGATIFPF